MSDLPVPKSNPTPLMPIVVSNPTGYCFVIQAVSEWDERNEVRFFSQTCEPLELPYHEDTCVVLPGNPEVWNKLESHRHCQ